MKKRKLSKLVSLLLALVIAVSTSFSAYAAEPRYVPDGLYITIYTRASGSGSSSIINGDYGHAFIEISNYSGSSVKIGAKSVPNNSSMTIGRWKTDEHSGIYYDLEAMRYNKDGKYYYKSRVLSESARASINSWLLNTNNNKWQINANCSHLAITLWNYAAPSTEDYSLSTIQTPTDLQEQMIENGYEDRGKPESETYAYYASGSTVVKSSYTANSW